MGVFSWPQVESTYWLAQAFWYCSLALAISALISSAQQSKVLDSLPSTSDDSIAKEDLEIVAQSILRLSPSQNLPQNSQDTLVKRGGSHQAMVYVWQCPTMFMSYAWLTFLVGLTLHICTPLILGYPWGNNTKVSLKLAAVSSSAL